MSFEEKELEGEGGHRISAWLARPDGEPRGLVQVLHGMAEHAARYRRFAEALADEGWAVVAHDHRGHGPGTAEADLGHFADERGWELVLSDVRRVRSFGRDAVPTGPLCLFGHSMGSFVATSDQVREPGTVDGLVLSGSSRGGGALVRVGRLAARLEVIRQGKRGTSGLLAALSFGSFNRPFEPARTPFDWLSRDAEEVDRYVDDPLCGFRCTNQLWVDLTTTLLELGDPRRLRRLPSDLPVYLFCGERDPVSEGGAGARALVEQLRAAGLTDIELKVYPEARHETLNETNRDEVVGDLVTWLERLPT